MRCLLSLCPCHGYHAMLDDLVDRYRHGGDFCNLHADESDPWNILENLFLANRNGGELFWGTMIFNEATLFLSFLMVGNRNVNLQVIHDPVARVKYPKRVSYGGDPVAILETGKNLGSSLATGYGLATASPRYNGDENFGIGICFGEDWGSGTEPSGFGEIIWI